MYSQVIAKEMSEMECNKLELENDARHWMLQRRITSVETAAIKSEQARIEKALHIAHTEMSRLFEQVSTGPKRLSSAHDQLKQMYPCCPKPISFDVLYEGRLNFTLGLTRKAASMRQQLLESAECTERLRADLAAAEEAGDTIAAGVYEEEAAIEENTGKMDSLLHSVRKLTEENAALREKHAHLLVQLQKRRSSR
jgi:hypothetical protein